MWVRKWYFNSIVSTRTRYARTRKGVADPCTVGDISIHKSDEHGSTSWNTQETPSNDDIICLLPRTVAICNPFLGKLLRCGNAIIVPMLFSLDVCRGLPAYSTESPFQNKIRCKYPLALIYLSHQMLNTMTKTSYDPYCGGWRGRQTDRNSTHSCRMY